MNSKLSDSKSYGFMTSRSSKIDPLCLIKKSCLMPQMQKNHVTALDMEITEIFLNSSENKWKRKHDALNMIFHQA